MASTRRQGTPSGTQSIERAIHLLKLLTTRSAFGWGLTELAQRSELDKATVHRILARLEEERLVQRHEQKHRYLPGPMLVELGLSVSAYHPLLDQGRDAINRLAHRTGGVAFFYLRSDRDFVVAGRMEETPHVGMLNDVGYRRPLMMSAGGIAMLLAMPSEMRAACIRHNLTEMARMGIPKMQRFERMLERSLDLGYSANLEDVAAGINSFAVPVFDHAMLPLGAISVAGDPQRFPATMGRKIVDLLSFEASQLSDSSPMADMPAEAALAMAAYSGSA